jgi:hypothetical protein
MENGQSKMIAWFYAHHQLLAKRISQVGEIASTHNPLPLKGEFQVWDGSGEVNSSYSSC